MDVSALPYTVELCHGESAQKAFLRYVDQTRLPYELHFEETDDWHEVVKAIKRLEIRGAPAIGLAGAAAYALAVFGLPDTSDPGMVVGQLESIALSISDARPTAVNLKWAVDRMRTFTAQASLGSFAMADLRKALFDEVRVMEEEDEAANRAIGSFGAALLEQGSTVLTHCNAGSLATRFYGTALGVVYAAAYEGKIERVFVDETRPVGQGARLTSWELSQVGIPATLICDNMAASLMAQGGIDAVIVGADRICRNGDVVNKIGTYGLAVSAHHHGIPFYVAAPTSTIDTSLDEGSQVVIEERGYKEVAEHIPEGVRVFNPAFDMTPAALVSAIVTDQGVFSVHDGSWATLVH